LENVTGGNWFAAAVRHQIIYISISEWMMLFKSY